MSDMVSMPGVRGGSFQAALARMSPVEKAAIARQLGGAGNGITTLNALEGAGSGGMIPYGIGSGRRAQAADPSTDKMKAQAIRMALGLVEPSAAKNEYDRLETNAPAMGGPTGKMREEFVPNEQDGTVESARVPEMVPYYNADTDIVISDSTGQKVGAPATEGKNFTRERVRANPEYAAGKAALQQTGQGMVDQFWPNQENIAKTRADAELKEVVTRLLADAHGNRFEQEMDLYGGSGSPVERTLPGSTDINPQYTRAVRNTGESYANAMQQLLGGGAAPSGAGEPPPDMVKTLQKLGATPEAIQQIWAKYLQKKGI